MDLSVGAYKQGLLLSFGFLEEEYLLASQKFYRKSKCKKWKIFTCETFHFSFPFTAVSAVSSKPYFFLLFFWKWSNLLAVLVSCFFIHLR